MKTKGKTTKRPRGDWRLVPIKGTIQIIVIYVVLGISWIFLSDTALGLFIGDPQVIEDMQLGKGIFYVLMTAVLFYLIIKRRMDLYLQSIAELKKTNDQLRNYEKQLYDVAYIDPLSGLPNRNRLKEVIEEHIRRGDNALLGIIYIDINDFKTINEVKGFEAGDMLISTLTRDIQAVAGPPHEAFRYSGDQFIILLRDLDTREHMERVVQRYTNQARRSVSIQGDEYFFSLCVGIAAYPEDGSSYDELIQRAEIALQMAKRQGPGAVVNYQPEFFKLITDNIELTNMLHQALSNNEIHVHYQPIYDARTRGLYGLEALIRWKQPKRGNIPPLQFISTAEKSGQIVELTKFVIQTCFAFHHRMIIEGMTPIPISINMSSKLLLSDDFIAMLTGLISKHEVPTSMFIFEVTESLLVDNMDLAIARLEAVRSLGFKIALDDFGTGYSSLTYLQRLPLDILKIDRSFIMRLDVKKKTFPFLTFMIELGHALKLQVVAEGVETKEQKNTLEKIGIDSIQGYLYAKPLDEETSLAFTKEHGDTHDID